MKATLQGDFGSATIDLPDNAKENPAKLQAYIDNFETHAQDIKDGKMELPDFDSFAGPQSVAGGGPAGGMGDVKMAESPAGAPQPSKEWLGYYGPRPNPEALAAVPRFAGDVGKSLSTGIINAAAQGTQDNWGHPLDILAGIAGDELKNVASPFHTFETPIQSTATSLERAGVPNAPQPPPMRYPGEVFPGGDAPIPGLAEQAGTTADMFTPLFGGNVLAKTLSYIPGIVKAAGGGVGFINKQAGRMASELSGVPEEALRAYGDPIQRAKMTANVGKENEIGSDLLNHIDNPDQFLPERQQVAKALENMGDVSVQSAVDALNANKAQPVAGRLLPNEVSANEKIQTYIDALRGVETPKAPHGNGAAPTSSALVDPYGQPFPKPVPPPPDPKLPAAEYRDLRKKLDVNIDHNTEDGDIINKALSAGRSTMKNELLKLADKSGNPEYAQQMATWSDKLDKLDRIKGLLGKTGPARDKRVEQFINNLFGKNSAYKQQLMNDLDHIFQSDIVGRAKAADIAASLGEGGKPAILPRQVTGASLKAGLLANLVPGVGQIAAIGTASPRVAASLTLPVLTKMEQGIKAAGIAMTPRAAGALQALKGPISAAQRARLATLLATELEASLPPNAIPFRQKVAEQDQPTEYVTRR